MSNARKVAIILFVTLFQNCADAALRLFFSTIGASDGQSLIDANPGLSLPIPRTNPVVPSGTRMYLWAEMTGSPVSQRWSALSFNVLISGGDCIESAVYNYRVPDPDFPRNYLFSRWHQLFEGAIVNTGLYHGVFDASMAADLTGEGVANSVADAQYDLQSEIGVLASQGVSTSTARSLSAPAGFSGKSVLIGYYDITLSAGSHSASVFLQIGTAGIREESGFPNPPPSPVYLGVGDEYAGLLGDSFNMMSPVADALVTPEPANICVLLMFALCSKAFSDARKRS